MALLRREEGPLRKILTDGPIRRFVRERTTSYEMIPTPRGVDPADFVVNVARGDWAKNAAEGWANTLGLSGAARDDLVRRMQIAYAGGATRASPDVVAEAQRRLGVPLGPITPTPAPTRVARRPRVKVEEKPPVTPLPPAITLPEGVTQQQINQILTLIPPVQSIAKLTLVSDARREHGFTIRDPAAIIDHLVSTGQLEEPRKGIVRRSRG